MKKATWYRNKWVVVLGVAALGAAWWWTRKPQDALIASTDTTTNAPSVIYDIRTYGRQGPTQGKVAGPPGVGYGPSLTTNGGSDG